MNPASSADDDTNQQTDNPVTTFLPVSPVGSSPVQFPQAPPIVVTPQTVDSSVIVINQEPHHSRKGLKILLFFLFLFFIVSIIVLGIAYAITYGKIKINRPEIENPIAYFVQSLPFTPKTPKFLLTATLNAHKKINKHSIDLSFVYESDQLMSVLGASRLDAQVKGAADYSDIKNPLLNLSIDITKDFNVELRKPGKTLYGKINKLPVFLLTFLGLSPSEKLDSVLSQWFSYDTTPLETEARKSLDLNNNTTITNKAIQDAIDKHLNEKAMGFFKVSDDKLDGFSTYKITLISNDQFLDYIDEQTKKDRPSNFDSQYKTSDYISDLKLDCWIDQKSYYLRKVSVSYKMNNKLGSMFGLSANPIGNQSKSTVGMVLIMSDFNKPVVIDIPPNSISIEEYSRQLMELFPAYMEQQQRSADAKRKSDLYQIQGALDRAYTTTLKYPNNLDELITLGELKSVPVDPETKLPYEYKPTADRSGYTLSATLSDGSEYILSYP